jgi:hypothetical protein
MVQYSGEASQGNSGDAMGGLWCSETGEEKWFMPREEREEWRGERVGNRGAHLLISQIETLQ